MRGKRNQAQVRQRVFVVHLGAYVVGDEELVKVQLESAVLGLDVG